MTLHKYQTKRDFKVTPEPSGIKKKKNVINKLDSLKFVIQKHAASHLHYDFRLEINGVLKSWAVPKGLSVDPAVKRLAIEVEDHPIEYGDFEGIIPKKQYGAGTVMIWDTGYWECNIDPNNAYQEGNIKIQLHGKKLKGLWKLIKIKSDKLNNQKNNWLLIKAIDDFSRPNTDIVSLLPNSALTERSMDEITTETKIDIHTLSLAKQSLIPAVFKPELAYLSNTVPDGHDWLHEVKYDGYRILCFIEGKSIRFLTRNGHDWTHKFSSIIPDIKKLKLKNGILDGEIVAIEKGEMNFQALQSYLKNLNRAKILYFVFDLPYCNDYNLTQVPLIDRKEILRTLCVSLPPNANIVYSEFIQGNGKQVYQEAYHASLEGIMSKKCDSSYQSKRSHDWIKIKCHKRQEFVIGGYTKPKNNREAFGALLLGQYDNQNLIYCGKVGTGFSSQLLQEYMKIFSQHISQNSPFLDNHLIEHQQEITWLKPKCVGEVQFTEFTSDNLLRHASFLGLREDKSAQEVHREKMVPINSLNITKTNLKKTDHLLTDFQITHPEKILYPQSQTTKLDVAYYYEQVMNWILPYVVNRPLSVLRCPHGFGQTCFFQKHPHQHFSEYVYSLPIKTEKENYMYIKNAKGLLSLIQSNVLEIHPWGSKIDNVEKPDQITFDLDPDPHVPWKTVIQSALWIREELHKFDLESFIKTSGRKGLHIVTPITRRLEWPEIKAFSKQFALYLCKLYPEHFIANMSKEMRLDKIFIDYLRNGRGSTSVAAYSTRLTNLPTLSIPIAWSELKTCTSADYYTIDNILPRLKKIADPWQNFFKTKQSITQNAIIKLKKDIL